MARVSLAGEQTSIGPEVIPSQGKVRIPVIVISGSSEEPVLTQYSSFFQNDLDAHTFRNYWYVNSLGRYDTHCLALEWQPPASFPSPDDIPDSVPTRMKWVKYAHIVLSELHEEGILELGLFDTSGPDSIPDGWMDGFILFVPGFSGVLPVNIRESDKTEVGDIRIGPFIVASMDSSAIEILRGYAALLGFIPQKSDGICLSICSDTDNGFPLVDAYNRTTAGWTDVIEIGGPMQNVLVLPARTTGKVFRIGNEKEYFLIENRSAGGGYDLSIKQPGLAIYHVAETVQHDRLTPDAKWRPVVMNESPDGSFPLQTGNPCIPEQHLFREDDALIPDYSNQNPISDGHHPVNSNWYNGEPSDIFIQEIDASSHYPIITAVIGYQ